MKLTHSNYHTELQMAGYEFESSFDAHAKETVEFWVKKNDSTDMVILRITPTVVELYRKESS